MKENKRKKIIAIALVATLACSGSVTSVLAATDKEVTTIGTNVLSTEDESTALEENQADNTESAIQTDINEQAEHKEDETAVNEANMLPLENAAAVNNTATVTPRAGEVAIDATNFPDANFREFVKQYDTDNSGSLSDAEIAAVTIINCSRKQISSLTGIEYFTSLASLSCGGNQLTNLDVSQNTALEWLSCASNQLTNLDVSQNTALRLLSCESNQLTNLDVSQNTALEWLYCDSNQLTNLDVSQNIALIGLSCDSNQLTNLDLSQNTALTSLYCDSNQLTNLDVSQNTALIELYCDSNQLTNLDVSQNTALEWLYCNSNQLTNLDVSQNTALKWLHCNKNQLTNLDVSQNTALIGLRCSINQLTNLDLSQNTALDRLQCYSNRLTNLDVSQNTALTELHCDSNRLTNLDVSQNTALRWLYCGSNQLTNLDLANNPNIAQFIGTLQIVNLGQIPKEQYDLLQKNPNIVGDKIINPTGATFNGTVMSNYTNGTPVTYQYDADSPDRNMLKVTLVFDVLIVNSNIIYKDGNADFNSWKSGYTAPSTYEEGTELPLPTANNIEKEGYTFVGWYDNENFTGTPITEIDATATGDQTLYAKFEINQYTVTFKDWDGTELKTEQVAYNTGATAPADPVRDGYRFTGWDNAFGVITGDTVVTAQYVKTWTVAFQDEDGTVLKTEIVDEGTAATAPTEPTKEGHTFAGWDVTFDNVTADIVVTATYTVNQYTVTFKDWDGTELKTEQVAYNTGATAPADPTRDGYRFTGWDNAFGAITGDTVVTAQYEKENIVPPTEPEQPQTPGQGGEMNNTETEGKTQTGTNLETVKTGDNPIVEPLLATGGISSIAAAIAFFFRKKKKSEQ